MKPLIYISAALLLPLFTLAKINTDSLSTVHVLVVDFDKKPKEGQIIIFNSKSTPAVYQASSDAEGKFTLRLPFNDTYLITIKDFIGTQDYAEITIPALKEGQSGYVMNVTIEFEPVKKYTLQGVQFETASAQLTKESYAKLQDLLDYLLANTEARVEIAGHTDSEGDANENMMLSKKRAEAVKTYLVDNGVMEKQVETTGYGESRPVATNDTEEGRQANRRTEVRIIED